MDKLDEWMTRSEKELKNQEQKTTLQNQHPNSPIATRSDQSVGKQGGQDTQKKSGSRDKGSRHRNKRSFSGQQKKSGFQQKRSFQKKSGFQQNQQKRSFSDQPGKKEHVAHKTQGFHQKKSGPWRSPTNIPKKSHQTHPTQILRGKLKIIPLGGLDEVGKNMMAFEYEEDIVIIDMGLEFPSEDLFGIDYVIPDVSYLEENKKRIRGVLLSHGHLDHIGGIPYILPKLDYPPLYGTKLTMGLVQKRIEEFKLEKFAKLRVIDPEKPLKLGKFLCEFFRVAHSIPDALGISLATPVGKIVHTGDFKFDETPTHPQSRADIPKIKKIGESRVLALFCESTNALKPGHSISEKEVSGIIEKIIGDAKGRVIVASFSSQIGRIQQVIDAAAKNKRKIFVSGRSMRENIGIAARLGYIKLEKTQIKDIKKYKDVPDKETLILTTGSQGEAVSALTRIADNEHPHVKVKKDDTIILSSSPIIGNEIAIHKVINRLTILGADVIHNEIADVHTSGHGKQEELKKMINLIRPKYLIPIHGEFYMRKSLAKLAQKECGIPESRIIMIENGDVLLAENDNVKISKEKIDTKYILIDGLGEGQVGSQVQMDRSIMSQNGALVILIYISKRTQKLKKEPDVVSRGFIYMHESNEIISEVIKIAEQAYRNIQEKNPGAARKDIKKYIRQSVDKFTTSRLDRRPLIVPLIIED